MKHIIKLYRDIITQYSFFVNENENFKSKVPKHGEKTIIFFVKTIKDKIISKKLKKSIDNSISL